MKKGIGPQFLGAGGMNPKSTPCGHPKTMANSGHSPINFIDPNMQQQQMGMQPQIGIQPQQINTQQPITGSPIFFNKKLETAVDEGKITGKFANLVKANV